MAYTKLTPRFTRDAGVEEISRGSAYRLSISAGSAQKYRLAQLDDYTQIARSRFPLCLPLTLTLSARASSESIPGTWGFGLWNDPFGLPLGFGGNPFRLPALPNALWFFGASKESYLSFRSSEQENHTPTFAANGFIAQSFRAPKFHPLLLLAGLALPFSRTLTRRILGKVIDEDGIQLWDHEVQQQTVRVQSQGVDPTQWHRYRLEWRERQVRFEVDDMQVFESSVSPNPPLGLVIWLDNQYAAFTSEGKIGFGILENPEPAWLEIKELEVGD